nr:hypothetical protein [Tanacetum cinerariifolium]
SKAYKEYYACAMGEATPKPKASARKKKGDSASSTTPPTPTPTTTVVAAPRLSATTKGKQPARATTPTEPIDIERTEAQQLKIILKKSRQETHISQQRGSGTDEGTEEEESFDPIPRTPKGSEDESSNEEEQELRLSEEARIQEEEEADELYRDVNINQGRGLQVTQNIEDSHATLTSVHPDGPQESSSVSSFVTSMLNPISDAGVKSIFTTKSSPIVSLQTPTPIMTPSTIATITTSRDASIPPTTIPSIILENLPTFNSAFRFDERLRSLETTFSEYRQTNPFVDAVSAIPESVNATLEAEVLTRSSYSSRTSYAIAADLSEMELKKILIEKMEGNKSIQRSDEQRNLYKALVKVYDADKAILDTYGESTILNRRREDDDQEGPSAGSDRGKSAFAEEPVQTTC